MSNQPRAPVGLSCSLYAALWVFIQTGLLLALAPGHSIASRYLALNNWDSMHYIRIAENGYVIPASGVITSGMIHEGRANVVFFPGYPISARFLAKTTGIPVPYALPGIAQGAAFLFWLYFLLFLIRARVGLSRILSSMLVLAAHPGAFYLCVGYTESVFLASMMGFIYWSDRATENRVPTSTRALGRGFAPVSALIAALHGFAMSSTRIVAFAPAAYPFLRNLKTGRKGIALLLGVAGISGAIVFFLWCQVRFGAWDLYFKLEEIGWQNHRRWFAILNPLSYIPHFFFENSWDSLNRLSVTWSGMHLFFTAREKKRDWALWGVAFILFYIPLTGKANAHMDSMLRYTFPVTVLLIALQAIRTPDTSLFKTRTRLKLAALLLSFSVQIWCAYRFLRGGWVA